MEPALKRATSVFSTFAGHFVPGRETTLGRGRSAEVWAKRRLEARQREKAVGARPSAWRTDVGRIGVDDSDASDHHSSDKINRYLGDAIELDLGEKEARNARADVLADEPSWSEILAIEPVASVDLSQN